MTRFTRIASMLLAAAAFAACSVNEAGSIPCTDNANCPAAYPTCGSRGQCVGSAPPAALEALAGATQTAVSGSPLTSALTVRVNDTNGNPVQGFTIAWASAGGSVSVASTVTGTDGKTQVNATLGKKNGAYTFTATGAGLTGSPLTFTASGTSGAAAKLVSVSGADQTPVAGTLLGAPLVIAVTDSNDNPVQGIAVTWASTAGGGSVAIPTSTTGLDGTAAAVALSGKVVGRNSYAASAVVTGVPLAGSPILFNATGEAGTAATFMMTGPVSTIAGVPQNYTLTVQDSNGNVATGYRGTVAFSSNDINAALPANHTFTVADAGVFQAIASLRTAGTKTLTAVDAPLSATATGISVGPAATAGFSVAGFASPASADSTNSFSVTALDAYGNLVPGYRGTLHFTTTNPGALVPADYTFTANDTGEHTFSATLTTANAITRYSISATDTVLGSLTGSISGLEVDPAPTSRLTVTGFPASITSGVAGNVTVTALDSIGNVAIGYRGMVHFTTSNSNLTTAIPVDYTFTPGDAGLRTFSNGVTLGAAGTGFTLTATDVATPGITGTETGITVNPSAAVRLTLTTLPGTTVAGATQTFVVTAYDASNNVATGYSGTVHFTSTDGQSGLPSNSTLTNGVKTFSAMLKTVGSQTITATDTVTATIFDTSTVCVVTPAPAALFTVIPGGLSQNANLAFSFAVTAKDAFGNVATNYAGTVHFTSTDAQAVLPVDLTLSNGAATLSATLKTSGTFTLTAADTVSGVTGTSAVITVSPAGAASFTVVASPGTQVAGVALASVVVTAKDAFGNVATAYSGTVHFTSTDALASVPANTTLTNGTKTFGAVVLETVGSQTVTVADALSAGINGASNAVVVTPAAASILTVVPAGTSQTAGVPFNVTVTAKDQFGNTATGYAGTVQFTSTDGQAVLPADTTLTAGVKVFSLTLKTVGGRTVTAKDSVTPSITGTTPSITVSPAAVASLSASASSPQTAGTPFNVAVTAFDAFGNVATGYTGVVHFTSTDNAAILSADGTPTGGSGSFSTVLRTAGTKTVTATDTVSPSLTATGNITVNPAGAASLTVTPPAAFSQTAGAAFSITVTAKDTYSNTATGYAGTIHLTSTDFAAALPVDSGLTAGTKTFTVTLKTAGSFTVTATDTVSSGLTGTTASITVNAGATTKLVLSAFPTGVVAGYSNPLTVTAQDANNNTTPGYTGTVVISSSDGAAVLPASYQFQAIDAGARTFAALTLNTISASSSITVTDGTLSVSVPAISVVAPPLTFQSTSTLIVGGTRAGQIFIAGGSTAADNSGTANANTYFYNPATGAMLPGPSMQLPRYAHTATATTGGQIVIAGGNFSGGNSQGEFELCATDGGSPACVQLASGGAKRNSARCNAAAALVTSAPSFRVIIAGGDNCSIATGLTTWDVWDSASPTATTSNAGGNPLTVGRTQLTATALGTGKVLFAGGAATATADLFTNNATLANSTVAATGAMSVTRAGHTATLLKAAVTTACPSAGPCVLIAGGNLTANKTWEIYDAFTNTFPRGASAGHDLVAPRSQHAAAVFANGKVLLAGGSDIGGPTMSTESFDPTAGTLKFSTNVQTLAVSRSPANGTYASGQDLLIVVGGNASALPIASPGLDQLATP